MSARDTLPRPDARAEPEDTQPMDLAGLTEDQQKTVRVQPEPMILQPTGDFEELDEATKREQDRERRRAERDEVLGIRRKAVQDTTEETEVDARQTKDKRSTDKFIGSAGLFVLRVVAAGIIGLHGFAKALDLGAVQGMLAQTVIPEPMIMAYVLTAAEVAIALALLFGLLTRLAGLGLAAIGTGALVFVRWTTNPFTGNQLAGELELLLAGVGVLFVCLGAGGWSIDRAFRRRVAAGA